MGTFDAMALCEGMTSGTEDEQIEAWQTLIDTGLAWTLPGHYGRQAAELIDAGVCHI